MATHASRTGSGEPLSRDADRPRHRPAGTEPPMGAESGTCVVDTAPGGASQCLAGGARGAG